MGSAAVVDIDAVVHTRSGAGGGGGGGSGRGSAGKKRKGSCKGFNRSKSVVHNELDDQKQSGGNDQNQFDFTGTSAHRKVPRHAAACSNFKEKVVRLSEKTSIVKSMENHLEEEEINAVQLTRLGPEDQPPCRKLVDFILHDSDGNPQPFEMSEIDDTFITSVILPMDEELEKVRDRGVKCEGFGRIETWSISGYDEGTPVIWVSTDVADYECVKPAGSYKKFYDRFCEKAHVCIEVFKILPRSQGGNLNLTLEELLAKVARSMSGNKSFPMGPSGIDFIVSLGEFIYNQLIGLDESPENDDIKFATLPVLISLREQCRSRSKDNGFLPLKCGGVLKIKGNHSEAALDEDEKLARLLQEEEDWKYMKQQNSRHKTSSRNKFYIKINEDEIANDYPLPAYYKPSVQEMDEYIFSESDGAIFYSDALPTRVLDNWALYNSDSRLISLELLPMKPCAETDVTIFGSGVMRDDDGSGFCLDLDPSQSHSSSSSSVDDVGVPIYLSSVKEWMIEFGSSMIFISIRTDMAWYRLGKPTKQYAPWYEPVLKTARLAVSIIALLKDQTRASKLSFSDVIKKVSEFDKTHPAYISSNMASVERYVVVHGQIILQQFSEYPDEMIRKSAFIVGLSEGMELRHHTKLFMKKKVVAQKETNMNPSAMMVPVQSSRKAMRATTTRLINKIWGEYYSNYLLGDSNEGQVHEPKEEEEFEEQEDEEEEVELEEPTVIAESDIQNPNPSTNTCISKLGIKEIKWEGTPIGIMDSGWSLYRSAIIYEEKISVGGVVLVDSDQLQEKPTMIFVEYMFETPNGGKMIHGRVMKKGTQTMLGNAANKREVFLTKECLEIELANVKESVTVVIRNLPWGHQHRKGQLKADKLYQSKAEEREKKGLPVEYFCKSLYWPERGAFFTLPFDTMGLGTGACYGCKMRENEMDEFKLNTSKTGFVYKKVEYHVHDFVYVSPEHIGVNKEDRETFKSGRNIGLKAYAVCHLLEIKVPSGSKELSPETTQINVRRFYRPEDISDEKAYRSDIRELFYSENILDIPVEALQGKCEIRKRSQLSDLDEAVVVDHIFYCERSYDPKKGVVKQLSANVKIQSRISANDVALKKAKGKSKCKEEDGTDSPKWKDVPKENRLSTLDIFAGCGGLSEGLQQSGVSFTKWAIEFEQSAGEAFCQNHPEALVFIDNCNVILRAIMDKCGDADECISTSEATELAAKVNEEKRNNLPLPGQVDFINGGPPCQGFSGMNRFNQSTWSKVQCEMVLAFLSFADYFRPRFFLLENVRNFVSFNKGQTFRLTLASLLEMGYQVRFGILEAGAFGVSQSRKRAFIWAASPQETLPEWPEPMYVFASPELKVSLSGNMQYVAVHSTAGGAPFRSITVRDTIGDLPPVSNGASGTEIEYGGEPVSWFQKQIRGNTMVLCDHISKEMNELNLIRCQHVPCRPGADWRDLPEKKVKLSTGQMVDLIPWCLPNTAKRHNQWKGLFGRLHWEGNFPTSITDPQPMGKVGMCFHPEQDRILTVRECARSQGFLDSYKFAGNIQNKHKQIGNAVPPPLAYSLGRKLKEVVDRKRQKSTKSDQSVVPQ